MQPISRPSAPLNSSTILARQWKAVGIGGAIFVTCIGVAAVLLLVTLMFAFSDYGNDRTDEANVSAVTGLAFFGAALTLSFIVTAGISGGRMWLPVGFAAGAIAAWAVFLHRPPFDSFQAITLAFIAAACISLKPQRTIDAFFRVVPLSLLGGLAFLQSEEHFGLTVWLFMGAFPAMAAMDQIAASLSPWEQRTIPAVEGPPPL